MSRRGETGGARPLEGQVAVVTGANSGVGRSVTELLADAGARVVMICRDRGRGEGARDEILAESPGATVELELADLADQASVRDAAARLAARLDRVDILIDNAGVWRERRETSPDGFEVTFATNHLGHFLLTVLLLDPLRAGRGRVAVVSSGAHHRGDLRRAPLDDIARGRAWRNGIQAYGDSKLANVLFAFELARRGADSGLTAHAVHPGVLATRIWNQNLSPLSLLMRLAKPFLAKPRAGGEAVFRLVADQNLEGVSGRYFAQEEAAEPAAQARDEALARELWEKSAEWTGLESDLEPTGVKP